MAKKTHCKRGHPRTAENLNRWSGCRLCARIIASEDYKLHGKEQKVRRKEALWSWYGIKDFSMEQYQILMAQQNELCAVCHKLNGENRAFAVDHDHNTGRVRGLVHDRCNRLLGAAGDNAERLEEAAAYLRRV